MTKDILLFDELNDAPPAVGEAIAELAVTMDGYGGTKQPEEVVS